MSRGGSMSRDASPHVDIPDLWFADVNERMKELEANQAKLHQYALCFHLTHY